MKTYDDVEGFIDYTSKEEWVNYIKNHIIPLWKLSWMLKEYFEELKREFDNLPLNEVKEEEKSLLLGGIKPLGTEIHYSKNSLAKFYLNFFGLRLKDLQSWILQQQYREALTEIVAEVVETEFIKLIRDIFNLLDYALQYQTLVSDYFEEPQLNYEELKRNPEKVKELIKNWYQALLNITLNYNYGTFFLCSINQITHKYMKAAYPRIDQILDFLQNEFGLTELDWNNPIKPETQTYRDYTIYCFPEYNPRKPGKSFGGAICKLNELLWNKFSYSSEIKETLSMLFGEIPNLKEEFKRSVIGLVPEEYFDNVHLKNILVNARKMSINRGFLERVDLPITELFDRNSPHMFLSLLKISQVSENYIDFESEWR